MRLSSTQKMSMAFIFMVTALFSVLNLAQIITLPWIWVLSPIWVPMVTYIVGMTVVAILRHFLDEVDRR